MAKMVVVTRGVSDACEGNWVVSGEKGQLALSEGETSLKDYEASFFWTRLVTWTSGWQARSYPSARRKKGNGWENITENSGRILSSQRRQGVALANRIYASLPPSSGLLLSP